MKPVFLGIAMFLAPDPLPPPIPPHLPPHELVGQWREQNRLWREQLKTPAEFPFWPGARERLTEAERTGEILDLLWYATGPSRCQYDYDRLAGMLGEDYWAGRWPQPVPMDAVPWHGR